MPYTYASYVTALAELMATDAANTDFAAILPSIITYAEQRIYRELDLLSTVTRDTGALTTNSRNFTLPQTNGRFVVVKGINVVTPSSQVNPDLGTRNPVTPVSRDVLDLFWPSMTGAGVPTQFAPITDQLIIVGPAPDAEGRACGARWRQPDRHGTTYPMRGPRREGASTTSGGVPKTPPSTVGTRTPRDLPGPSRP